MRGVSMETGQRGRVKRVLVTDGAVVTLEPVESRFILSERRPEGKGGGKPNEPDKQMRAQEEWKWRTDYLSKGKPRWIPDRTSEQFTRRNTRCWEVPSSKKQGHTRNEGRTTPTTTDHRRQ